MNAQSPESQLRDQDPPCSHDCEGAALAAGDLAPVPALPHAGQTPGSSQPSSFPSPSRWFGLRFGAFQQSWPCPRSNTSTGMASYPDQSPVLRSDSLAPQPQCPSCVQTDRHHCVECHWLPPDLRQSRISAQPTTPSLYECGRSQRPLFVL